MESCLKKEKLESLGLYQPLEDPISIDSGSLNGTGDIVDAYVAASERATQLGLGKMVPEKVCLLTDPKQLYITLEGGSSFSYPITERSNGASEAITIPPDDKYNSVKRSCI
ncbi:MAG: hypothetical protein KAJ91_04215 [Candidatus Aenigmarchaeota archaeon]|nr:hypothetical protein [Candidatus Aenigmarchaeota archaeon]MCK5333088.1 hypothetical protein [Candidatus Aenigmarchaeota archaeon]